MTPNEFKSWFQGFTELMEQRMPTRAQWERIKERVAEIDGKAVTERVFVDRYWPYYWPYQHYYQQWPPLYTTCNTGGTSGMVFNSNQAMHSLGQLEAEHSAS